MVVVVVRRGIAAWSYLNRGARKLSARDRKKKRMALVSNSEEMSGRSSVSFASSMSGRGSDSGRGGRERQGAAQNALNQESSESSSGENDEFTIAPTVQRSTSDASRRDSYSRWTEEKKTIALQAIIDTPRRMVQNPSTETGFERNINRSGVSKTSIDKLEYTSDLIIYCY